MGGVRKAGFKKGSKDQNGKRRKEQPGAKAQIIRNHHARGALNKELLMGFEYKLLSYARRS